MQIVIASTATTTDARGATKPAASRRAASCRRARR